MKNIIMLIILVALAWQGYQYYEQRQAAGDDGGAVSLSQSSDSEAAFRCDGRMYCSQMHSCAEATYFLKNCPGVKLDPDNNGVPCAQQWCNQPRPNLLYTHPGAWTLNP
jgi:hypothetical protein